MVRPRKLRRVHFEPDTIYFKPQGIPLRELGEICLTVDELEALRLSEIEKFSQTKAAKKMEIHQSTFQRILAKAREKVTIALVKGNAIKIEGGQYKRQGSTLRGLKSEEN